LAQTAAREYDFFTDSFGAAETSHLNVGRAAGRYLGLPCGRLSWRRILGSRVSDKSGVRLLANTIAPPVVAF